MRCVVQTAKAGRLSKLLRRVFSLPKHAPGLMPQYRMSVIDLEMIRAMSVTGSVPLPWPLFINILLFSATLLTDIVSANGDRQVYIVYMGDKQIDQHRTEALHQSILEQVLEGSSAKESLIYSYGRSFNGFAAKLTPREQQKLAGKEGIVSVFPSKTMKLHTTRSWDFIGLPGTAPRVPEVETDIIIGLLDTGIWPESASFRDEGLGPPPSRWKGTCQNLPCNNKLIGARYYSAGQPSQVEESPRDFEGHGTHTASTAAGREVAGAGFDGIAQGTIRGAVPSARIAVYKVCWKDDCADQDILAALDDAIADGVDVLSASIGNSGLTSFLDDALAIGSFHAMKRGVLTSSSAGNRGDQRGSTSNLAPWMMSVAASTIDRKIIDRVVTGDGEIIEGTSINTYDTGDEFYPFTYGGRCDDLDDSVKGKIVLCNLRDEGSGLLRAGAKGAVMVEESSSYVASTFLLPAIVVGSDEGGKLRKYIKSSAKPVARIERTSTVVDSAAPFVAPFSSRGPNRLVPDILKPDVSAPGLNILSAWSPKAAIPGYSDGRSLQYNFMTGTSSSCPHAAGAAAYVKSFHRDWSPAAIRSALMTTALPMDPSKNSDAEFAFGAGQINPVAATNPGLVYDVGVEDYILTLCSMGYNSSDVALISGEERTCPSDYVGSPPPPPPRDLNYPSMALRIDTGTPSYRANFSRTVTNVGAESSAYNASIETSGKIDVEVEPAALTFTSLNEKQSFVVTVSWHEGFALGELARATLTWSDGLHSVRSPIIVYTFV